MSFDRGAPAFWFVEIFLDGETLRHCNAGEPVTFDGQTFAPLGDKLTPPRDIDRAANLKAQKFTLTYDSSLQTIDTDVVGKILDSNWKRRPIRVRYAVGDVGASGYDFSDPFIIADEAGRIKDLQDTLAAGEAPLIEMEVESGALVFLERRNQTRSPANQKAAFPGDQFFDLARRLDGVVLPWRTKRARLGSAQITYDVEGVAPRQMLIGRGITRGSFVFGCTVGPHRGWWIQVFALADHQCEALEKCFINGVDVLAGQAPLAHGVKRNLNFGGEPRLSLTWYDGRHDQTANAELISLTSAQELKWTSAHRGRGVCYAIVEHRWDSDLPESYTHEFVLRGAKVYREQFDSTAGGSGSQRLDNPDTWTYTTNPEEALRHYLRGRVVSPSSSYKWFGVNAPSSFIDPYAVYEARADHCDESVALKLGGTQPRYEANGWISAADSHAKNIQKLADCMVADPVDEGGRVSIRLSTPQTPVIELEDSDLVDDEESVVGVNARAEDVINRVEGRYVDPLNKFSQTDYPPVASEAFEEIDGGEIEGSWNQELETSEERAQRKATLYLNKMRRTVEFEEHFGPKAKDVRPGDWITRKSALRGFPSGKTFIADEVRRFADGTVRLLLLEVDPGELAWNEADAQLTDIGAGPTIYAPPEILIPEVAVLAISLTGGGTTYPGVRFTVTDYDDFVGDEIECEFGIWNGVSGAGMGIAGTPAILKIPGSLEQFEAAASFLPGTAYAFRFRERAGERQGAWSAFQTETMTGDYIVGASAIADAIVGQGPGATAAGVDVLNQFVPLGSNLLIDSEFQRQLYAWQAGWAGNSGVTHGIAFNGYGAAARNYYTAFLTGTPAAGTVFDVLATRGSYLSADLASTKLFAVPVNPGDRLYIGAQITGERITSADVRVIWVAADGSAVSSPSVAAALPAALPISQITSWTRIGGFVTAPAGAAYAVPYFRAVCSGAANPYCVVTAPMIAKVPASQTAAPPYQPGRADPVSDKTSQNNAASITGQGPGATAPNYQVLNQFAQSGGSPIGDWDYENSSYWALPSGAGFAAGSPFPGSLRSVVMGASTYDFSSEFWKVEPGEEYEITFRWWNGFPTFSGYVRPMIHVPGVVWLSARSAFGIANPEAAGGTVGNDITVGGTSEVNRFVYTIPSSVTILQFRMRAQFANANFYWRFEMKPTRQVQRAADITGQNNAASFTGQGLLSFGNYYEQATDPGGVPNGSFWFRTTTNDLFIRRSGAWALIANVGAAGLSAQSTPALASNDRFGAGNVTVSGYSISVSGNTGALSYTYSPPFGVSRGGTNTAPTFTRAVGVGERYEEAIPLQIFDAGTGRTANLVLTARFREFTSDPW